MPVQAFDYAALLTSSRLGFGLCFRAASELIQSLFGQRVSRQLTTAPKLKPVNSPEQLRGKLPVLDKDYLCEMGTQSLSDLGEEVRRLSQSIGQFGEQQKKQLKASEKSIQQMQRFTGAGLAILGLLMAFIAYIQR